MVQFEISMKKEPVKEQNSSNKPKQLCKNDEKPIRLIMDQQQKLTRLFCQFYGDISMIVKVMKKQSTSTVCRQLNPLITHAIKKLEKIIEERKLRKVLIKWTDSQLKKFRPKFYQIKDNKLYGVQRRVPLKHMFKLMKMRYDKSLQLTDEEANELYEGCLDLNFAIDEDSRKSQCINFGRLIWNKQQQKVFCRFLLQNNNFQHISECLNQQYGNKQQFAPSKLYLKVDGLLRASIRKIRIQCEEHPSIETMGKIERIQYRNLGYGTQQSFINIRNHILEYFLNSDPKFEQTSGIVAMVNMFIKQSKIFQENKSHKIEHQVKKLFQKDKIQQLEKIKRQYFMAQEENSKQIMINNTNNVNQSLSFGNNRINYFQFQLQNQIIPSDLQSDSKYSFDHEFNEKIVQKQSLQKQ